MVPLYMVTLLTAMLLLPILALSKSNIVLLDSTRNGTVRYYEMHITLRKASPDCYKRNVILINGLFMPAIEVNVNDTLVVNVFNELPKDYPQVTNGVSIHWHGLSMWNEAQWYDGVAYVTQCPIQTGTNFTYSFLVNESPGTFFWHDHANANRADGLQGALIVRPLQPSPPTPYPVDGEHVLMLQDWYHKEGNALAMALNRPMDPRNVTKDSGSYSWVGNPESLLINGLGHQKDCNMTDLVDGDNGYMQPVCNVARLKEPKCKRGSKTFSFGCQHAMLDVEPNKKYMIRIINAGMTAYLTVCFEGHPVSIIIADSTPVDEVEFNCIDVNIGQRYDVILTTPKSLGKAFARNFWISVSTQYMTAGPAAYAMLRYSNAPAGAMPPTPAPQPGVVPWGPDDISMITTHEGVLGYLDNYEYWTYWQQFIHGGVYGSGVLYGNSNRTIVINTTSPMIQESGQARWAMNNVVSEAPPPCTPVQLSMMEDPTWLERNSVLSTANNTVSMLNKAIVGIQEGDGSKGANMYLDGHAPPLIPAIGMRVIEIAFGEVIDIVINNRPTPDGSGPSGRSTMQHPMHLHGHKFWIMGQGSGVYNTTTDEPYLNWYNPLLRDTLTLMPSSWVLLRFVAANPGIWPLHCHVLWHHFMGQQVFFLEAADRIAPPPKNFPICPQNCTYNLAPFKKSFVKKMYGKTKYDLPGK